MANFVLMLVILAAQPPSKISDFAVSAASGTPIRGRLISLDVESNAILSTANDIATVNDWYAIRRVDVRLPPFPRGSQLITTTGDHLPGHLTGGDAQSLRFRPSFCETDWEIPVASTVVVWTNHLPADTAIDPIRYPWLSEARKRDLVRFTNGDSIQGTFDGLSGGKMKSLALKAISGEKREMNLAEVAAVAFNPVLARSRKPKGAYHHLVLRDGTRLDLMETRIGDGRIKGKTLYSLPVELSLDDLVAMTVLRGRASDLADLKPKKVEQTGFLGPVWNWVPDRSVRGAALKLNTSLGVETFDRGLGMHPRTELTYDLSGKYRRLEATVGLDAVSGARGRAIIQIRVDGKEQLKETALTAGLAIPILVDVSGARELILSVDFAPTGDTQADVDWADARLIH